MAWESVPGNDAGSMNGDGSRKLLLHDTEGSTIEGAVGAYRKNNSWPTLTVDCRRRRVVRHLSDTVAARSLRNRSGGVETNRDGSVLIQIEIVGFANNRDGSMFSSREDYLWFGREVVGPLCRRNSIPLASTVRWVPYPASYGVNAAQRLSGAQWDAYSGVLAHQHCPENDHGDTGAIDVDLILSAARGDDFMSALSDDEQRELLALLRTVEDRTQRHLILDRDQFLDPAEHAAARANAKTLIIGSIVHGLRKPEETDPPEVGEGDLRGLFRGLIDEALDARLGPADPAG